jgi:hypothetical protein
VHTLPPRESVDVHLAFVPAEEYQECDPAEQDDLHFTSNLVAIFQPLGLEQLLPLSADYVYPTLTVALHKRSTASLSTPNCMEFGLVHLHAPRTMKVRVVLNFPPYENTFLRRFSNRVIAKGQWDLSGEN